MIERQTTLYLIGARPQAPSPPPPPPAKQADPWDQALICFFIFMVGLVFGIGVVISNQPQPSAPTVPSPANPPVYTSR